MLDLRYIREHPADVAAALRRRGEAADVAALLELDRERRRRLARVESLRAERNRASKEIGRRRRAGEEVEGARARVRALGEELAAEERELGRVEERLEAALLDLPNLPLPDVPVGPDARANREVRRWGAPPRFDFPPRTHVRLGEALGGLDLEAAARTSGHGFYFLLGPLARLERALIQWMMDLHVTEHGYREVAGPYLVRPACCVGTGQLPRLEDDMYRVERDDLYLIPTAEVSLTNYYRETVLPAAALPLRFVGFSPCYRREAGSHGQKTLGLQRVHQFHKVELVVFTRPEDSVGALEELTGHAEAVLRRLGLHYRVVALATGDLGFASAKTYDLEVWAPGMARFLEVSSASNFLDFQARRARIRYREPRRGLRYVHTLNASGLALPRLLIALLETYQDAAGGVTVPPPLRPYLGGTERLEA